jgi:hypothetical protein
MKIIFKNVSELKLKIAICVLTFVLGLCILVLSIIVAVSPLEYQTVNGIYDSYREDRVGMHTTKRYLTVEISDLGQIEYEIHQIAISAFDKKSFLQEVAIGDPMELILDDDGVVAIRVNGKSYLNLEDSLKKQRNNNVAGYYLGGGFIAISVFAFSTLITVRRGRRSKKRKC